MSENIIEYVKNNEKELCELLRRLCVIPAPSHNEEKRAEFCKDFLEKCGADGVYIDKAKNVIFPVNCEGKNDITVFAAHTDTVFPDTEPYPMHEDEEKLYCPGVGDDTASVCVLMYLAKYFAENRICADKGVLFVMNSCEEGLGNLDGTKQLFRDFDGRIGRFISFDSHLSNIHNVCVGSHRYEVEALTQGGHSFSKFGNKNAIQVLSGIIGKIYEIEVPKKKGSVTTYNVGTIEGGTSVNTIAQNAKMLCEYRSNNRDCLEEMRTRFAEIFESARSADVTVNVKLIGERPCSGEVDEAALEELFKTCRRILEEVTESSVGSSPASTDCNIPLSLGIPAICIGVLEGMGSHTREEYVIKASLAKGLEAALKIAAEICL